MKGKKLRIGIVAALLVAMFAMATIPTEAATDLKITDYNLNELQYHAQWASYGSGWLMKWPSTLDAKYQYSRWVGNIHATQVNDNYNGYPGECVSLVKALAKNNVATANWIKGNNVIWAYAVGSPIAPGTAIATFNSNNKYEPGHAAFFRSYTYDIWTGQVNGFWVWDQNYLPSKGKVVAWHWIKMTSTTNPLDVGNANNYFVVRVP